MRQVPLYAIVGSGLMAQHFAHYLSLLNIPYVQISARKSQQDKSLLQRLDSCHTVCLAIKDSYISEYYIEHIQPKQLQAVHFSGALSVEGCPGIHPLGMFSSQLFTLEQYSKITFVAEAGHHSFENLMPGLPNHHIILPKEHKAFYHCMCVISSNFSSILWQKAIQEFHKLGLDFNAVKPFLQSCFNNLIENPNCSLTGPLQRNDHKTIESNLKSIENDPFHNVYKAFIQAIS